MDMCRYHRNHTPQLYPHFVRSTPRKCNYLNQFDADRYQRRIYKWHSICQSPISHLWRIALDMATHAPNLQYQYTRDKPSLNDMIVYEGLTYMEYSTKEPW